TSGAAGVKPKIQRPWRKIVGCGPTEVRRPCRTTVRVTAPPWLDLMRCETPANVRVGRPSTATMRSPARRSAAAAGVPALTESTFVEGLSAQRRYLMIAAAAIATPILLYLVGGLIFNAYTGSAGTILALIGVGALYAFIVGVIRLQVLLGQAAIIAMMAVFVFLNFPSAGGAIPASMLPGFWRFIHSFWIGGAAVDAIRSILYFGGQGVATDIVKLLAWLIITFGLLALPISRKLER